MGKIKKINIDFYNNYRGRSSESHYHYMLTIDIAQRLNEIIDYISKKGKKK